MWILASRKKGGYSFGRPLEDKGAILKFMKSFQPTGYMEGFVDDRLKNKQVDNMPDYAVEEAPLCWTRSDIYNLERYDMVLCDDFLDEVRRRIA